MFGNNIRTLPQSTLVNTNMINLHIIHTRIKTIHSKAFWSSSQDNRTSHTRLEHLDLTTNKIEYIKSGTFDPLINLIGIYLNNNKLAKIEQNLFLKIPKLKLIAITNNKLTNLPIKWLPSTLTTLYIQDNNIMRLTSETFHGAINLNELWLSTYNIIKDYNTFTDVSNLTSIRQNRRVGIKACNCDYIWYLNTNSKSKVCSTENNEIRKYLEDNCTIPS